MERERKIKKRQAEEKMGEENKVEPTAISFERVAMDILEHIVARRDAWYTGTPDCLGRNLCHLSRKLPEKSHLETVALKIATTVLLWVQLDDTSQSYINFLNNVRGDCQLKF